MISKTDTSVVDRQVLPAYLRRCRVSFVECPRCGYEPPNQLSTFQGRCPRCHGYSWQRLPRPKSLIEVQARIEAEERSPQRWSAHDMSVQ